MSISLETAEKHLNVWLEAELTIATGQSYTLATTNGSRTLTRASLTEVRDSIEYWNKKVLEAKAASKSRSRTRIYRAVPRDV